MAVPTLRPTREDLRSRLTLPTGAKYRIILSPLVVRVRMVGILFETDKTFVLPPALPGIRRLKTIYDSHVGKTVLVSGHTDRAGTTEHNLALSVEPAKAVAAFLRDDDSDWAPRYQAGTQVSVQWGTREDQHMGPAAGSEVETQLISDLIAAQQFRSSITYHNFSQLLLFPTAAKTDAYVQFVGKGMSHLIDAHGNPYTYEAGDALYPTTGDLMEFAYEAAPGRPNFTPEVRPGDHAPRRSAFSGLPEAEIEPTFQENLEAALALINCAGFDAPAASVKISRTPQTTVAQVVRNCWKVFDGFGA